VSLKKLQFLAKTLWQVWNTCASFQMVSIFCQMLWSDYGFCVCRCFDWLAIVFKCKQGWNIFFCSGHDVKLPMGRPMWGHKTLGGSLSPAAVLAEPHLLSFSWEVFLGIQQA